MQTGNPAPTFLRIKWYSVNVFFLLYCITLGKLTQVRGLFCFWEGCTQRGALQRWPSCGRHYPKISPVEPFHCSSKRHNGKRKDVFVKLHTACSGPFTVPYLSLLIQTWVISFQFYNHLKMGFVFIWFEMQIFEKFNIMHLFGITTLCFQYMLGSVSKHWRHWGHSSYFVQSWHVSWAQLIPCQNKSMQMPWRKI